MRIEQLYPFPIEDYQAILERYANAREIVWCQEEPQNQGAWYQIRHRLQEPLGEGAACCGTQAVRAPRRRQRGSSRITSGAGRLGRGGARQEGRMTTEVRVPQLPESVADATLVAWHKKAGEAVARDENLADLETDKVVLEVPAPAAGVLKSLDKKAGVTVTSGELLAVIEERPVRPHRRPRAPQAEPRKPVEAKKPEPATVPAPAAAAPKKEEAGGKLAPAARRLVEENKLAAGQIAGSGRDGRITKGDVAHHLEAAPQTPAAAPAGARVEQRVPMTRLRARIAERLVQAQSTAAMLTTFNEVDLKAVKELRARYKEPFEKKHGVRLGFMSFFVKACIEALRASRSSTPRSTATTSSTTSTTTSASRSRRIAA